MPDVSILIPVYNKKDYLEACIRALMDTRDVSFEVILVDDGSTDGSASMCDWLEKQYQNICVIHQLNQGVSAARNRALQAAQGEWIWFVDADDLPEGGFLDRQKSNLESDAYDLICADFRKCTSGGRKETVSTGMSGAVSALKLPELFMELQPGTGYFGYLWCKLLRRSFIDMCGISFVRGLKLAEDLKFMVALYRKAPRICFTDEIAMNYTVDAVNSSKDSQIDYRAQLEIRYEIYDWIRSCDCFDRFCDSLRLEVSRFCAFVFFYAYERTQSIFAEITWFQQHPEYHSCLMELNEVGIMQRIVNLLMHRQYQKLEKLLKKRYRIRALVRRRRHQ